MSACGGLLDESGNSNSDASLSQKKKDDFTVVEDGIASFFLFEFLLYYPLD